MKARNVLAVGALCLTAGLIWGTAGQAAQAKKGFGGKWATDAAVPFQKEATRPATANGAIKIEIKVDAQDPKKATGMVTEYINPLCGKPDAELPFEGTIDGKMISFSIYRPGANDCPPKATGPGTQVNWTATLSDDEQTLTGMRAFGARGGAGGRGGAPGGGPPAGGPPRGNNFVAQGPPQGGAPAGGAPGGRGGGGGGGQRGGGGGGGGAIIMHRID